MQLPIPLRGIRGRTKRWLYLQCAKIINTSIQPRLKPVYFQKVLIMNLQALGDLIIAIPALQALSKNVEQVEILVSEVSAPFLRTLPFLHKVHIFSEDTMKKIQSEKYDGIIDFQDTFTTVNRMKLAHEIPSRWRVGVTRAGFHPWRFDECHEKNLSHMFHHSTKLIEKCSNKKFNTVDFKWPALSSGIDELNLFFKNHQISSAQYKIGIHIPNKNVNKRWPKEHFAEVICMLHKNFKGNCVFILTGISSESYLVEEVIKLLPKDILHTAIPCINQLSASGIVELLRSLHLFISVDTGFFHLAGLTQTPTLGIFGPTLLNYWGAWAPSQNALSLELPCRPTEDLSRTLALQDNCCPYPTRHCLVGVTPTEVMKHAKHVLTVVSNASHS